MIDNIIDILEKQAKIYQHLIKLSEQMQQAITENNLKNIESLIQVESALTMKFSVLEKNREHLVRKLEQQINYTGENLNIVEIKKHATEQQCLAFDSLESRMSGIILELERLNTTNRMLIKNRLDIINFSLNYLGAGENNKIYENLRKNKLTPTSKLIDESI